MRKQIPTWWPEALISKDFIDRPAGENKFIIAPESARLVDLTRWQRIKIQFAFFVMETLDADAASRYKSEKTASLFENHIENILLPALNQNFSDEDFTDEEREEFFGSEKLTSDHITFANLNRLLTPFDVPSAVRRDDDWSDGSERNRKFRIKDQETGQYFNLPRTVIRASSEKHAKAMAKMLRILTESNGGNAKIIATMLNRGVGPEPVVMETIRDEVLQGIGRFMMHLAYKKYADKRIERENESELASVKAKIYECLEAGEIIEIIEELGVYINLATRAGVKKARYRNDQFENPVKGWLLKRKHEEKDNKLLGVIPKQGIPELTLGYQPSVLYSEQYIPHNSIRDQAKNVADNYLTTTFGAHFIRTFIDSINESLVGPAVILAKKLWQLPSENSIFSKAFARISTAIVYGVIIYNRNTTTILMVGGAALGGGFGASIVTLATTLYMSWRYKNHKRITGNDPIKNWIERIEKETGFKINADDSALVFTERQRGPEPAVAHPYITACLTTEEVPQKTWTENIGFANYVRDEKLVFIRDGKAVPLTDLLPAGEQIRPRVMARLKDLAKIYEEYKTCDAAKMAGQRFDPKTDSTSLVKAKWWQDGQKIKDNYGMALKRLRDVLIKIGPPYNDECYTQFFKELPNALRNGYKDYSAKNIETVQAASYLRA